VWKSGALDRWGRELCAIGKFAIFESTFLKVIRCRKKMKRVERRGQAEANRETVVSEKKSESTDEGVTSL
jgi:hypothetical protein